MHMVECLKDTGVVCGILENGVLILGTRSSLQFEQGFSKANEHVYKMSPKPWPGFPVDCLPSFIALASTHGFVNRDTTVNNWMYEDGLSYVKQLQQLEAMIKTYETKYGVQKIDISTSSKKIGLNKKIDIEGVPVIEGVRAIISYAIQREGETFIKDISPILRRSPTFIEKLQNIGVDIKVIEL